VTQLRNIFKIAGSTDDAHYPALMVMRHKSVALVLLVVFTAMADSNTLDMAHLFQTTAPPRGAATWTPESLAGVWTKYLGDADYCEAALELLRIAKKVGVQPAFVAHCFTALVCKLGFVDTTHTTFDIRLSPRDPDSNGGRLRMLYSVSLKLWIHYLGQYLNNNELHLEAISEEYMKGAKSGNGDRLLKRGYEPHMIHLPHYHALDTTRARLCGNLSRRAPRSHRPPTRAEANV
jgi:hypothetical protein